MKSFLTTVLSAAGLLDGTDPGRAQWRPGWQKKKKSASHSVQPDTHSIDLVGCISPVTSWMQQTCSKMFLVLCDGVTCSKKTEQKKKQVMQYSVQAVQELAAQFGGKAV